MAGLMIGLVVIIVVIFYIFNSQILKLKDKKEILTTQVNELNNKINEYTKVIDTYKESILGLNQKIGAKKQEWENLTDKSRLAFQVYANNLDKDYKDKENEYNLCVNNLKTAYETMQAEVIEKQDELDNLKKKRAAAQEILLNEEKLQANQDFYRLILSPAAKDDIEILKGVKDRLSIKRAINKLIWETYIRPLCKERFPQIIGNDTSACIYKITNIKNGKIYIGQHNADPADRWREHIKAALVDEKHNKFYDAIGEYGIDNFTFEVVEHCPIEQLNDREVFYVDLFDSYNNGYNSTRGGA